jgi:hypothetical protein
VIAVPLAAPEEARVVSRPACLRRSRTGAIAGLWRGGDHGTGTQRTSETNHCHDITAFPELGLAAGACSGNGLLLDISDPCIPSASTRWSIRASRTGTRPPSTTTGRR